MDRRLIALVLLSGVPVLSGCGLVKAPFRVAGALTNGAYQGGKKVADKTSAAMKKRKARKEKEEAAKAAAAAGETPDIGPVPAKAPANPPVEGPIIPLTEPELPAGGGF